MNRTTILKGLAICSSIALAGGFVVYRQKQAADPRKEEEPILQGSRSKVILPSSKNIDAILANPGQPDASSDKVLLPSSKSIDMPVFKRPADKKDPTLLPGSKALILGPRTSPINRDTIDGILDSEEAPAAVEGEKPEAEEKEAPAADSKEKDKP